MLKIFDLNTSQNNDFESVITIRDDVYIVGKYEVKLYTKGLEIKKIKLEKKISQIIYFDNKFAIFSDFFYVFDNHLQKLFTLDTIKNLQIFAVDLSTIDYGIIKFAIFHKKKILLVNYSQSSLKITSEINVYEDSIKHLIWYDESIIFATKNDYFALNVNNSQKQEICPCAKNSFILYVCADITNDIAVHQNLTNTTDGLTHPLFSNPPLSTPTSTLNYVNPLIPKLFKPTLSSSPNIARLKDTKVLPGSLKTSMGYAASIGNKITNYNYWFALVKDEKTLFYDAKSGELHAFVISWSEPPISITCKKPYFIGLLPNCIEIRSAKTFEILQSITYPKAKGMDYSNYLSTPQTGSITVWTSTSYSVLSEKPFKELIRQAIKYKLYDIALDIIKQADIDTEEKRNYVFSVKYAKAVNLFNEKQYKMAMNILTEIKMDPLTVINVFPGIMPSGLLSNNSSLYELAQNAHSENLNIIQKYLKLQEENKDMASDDHEILNTSDLDWNTSLPTLIEYLTDMRSYYITQLVPLTITGESTENYAKNKELYTSYLRIIDTCLLKCYAKTNCTLVSSLLRLPQTYCDCCVAERILRKRNMMAELVLFYQRAGLHEKALELLLGEYEKARKKIQARSPQKLSPTSSKDSNKKSTSMLSEQEEEQLCPELNAFIEYVEMEIDASKLDLLIKYLGKLHQNAQNKMVSYKILTSTNFSRDYDREKSLYYLIAHQPESLISYLQHIIEVWGEERTLFHNALINAYRETLITDIKTLQDLLSETNDVLLSVNRTSCFHNEYELIQKVSTKNAVLGHFYATDIKELNQTLCLQGDDKTTIIDTINGSLSYVEKNEQSLNKDSVKPGEADESFDDIMGLDASKLFLDESNESTEDISTVEDSDTLVSRELLVEKIQTLSNKICEDRIRLRKYLENPYYLPDTLLNIFLDDYFSVEKALIHVRLGNYSDALRMFTYTLNDLKLALKFCDSHYTTYKNIYYELISVLISPPDGAKNRDYLEDIIEILNSHYNQIPFLKVIDLLPNIPLTRIQKYLMNIFTNNQRQINHSQIVKGLLESKNDQVINQKFSLLSQQIIVDDATLCKLCMKKIKESTFVRYPNGLFAHYFCYKNPSSPNS